MTIAFQWDIPYIIDSMGSYIHYCTLTVDLHFSTLVIVYRYHFYIVLFILDFLFHVFLTTCFGLFPEQISASSAPFTPSQAVLGSILAVRFFRCQFVLFIFMQIEQTLDNSDDVFCGKYVMPLTLAQTGLFIYVCGWLGQLLYIFLDRFAWMVLVISCRYAVRFSFTL